MLSLTFSTRLHIVPASAGNRIACLPEWGPLHQAWIPAHERPQDPNQAIPGGVEAVQVSFKALPPASGKVRFTSAAGHLPSVRGRLVGRLLDAGPIRSPSVHLVRVLERDRSGSATRHHATSSGTASRRGDVRGRVASLGRVTASGRGFARCSPASVTVCFARLRASAQYFATGMSGS